MSRPNDTDLLRRAIKNARPGLESAQIVRWAVIRDLFAVGSTVAYYLCLEFGADPDELLDGPHCENCPYEEENSDDGKEV